jgi:hypothetical protein
MNTENVSFGIAMSLYGFVIIVDIITNAGPSLEIKLTKEVIGGLGIMISGFLYTISFIRGEIPLPEEGFLASKWLWYLGTAGILVATLVRFLSILDKF